MTSVKVVDPREMIRLLPRYLYIELDPGVKAVIMALKSGVKMNFGWSEKMSPRVLIEVTAFQ
jgi:hypothetical protein